MTASESTETPPPPARWAVVVDVALVLAVFVLQAGWPAPDVNEPHYLGKARHFWDPNWAAHDFFFESADTHLVFYLTCGWLTRWLSLAQFAWCGRLVTWLLLAVAWQRLCRSVVGRTGWSAFAAAIFLSFNVGCQLAGEWVVGGFEAKGLAYVLVFVALTSLVSNRWNAALVLLGAASAFHVLVGGWAAVAAAVCWLISADAPRLRQLWPGMVAGAVLALAGVLPALALNWWADPQIVAEASDIYVFRRLPHHLVPQSFRWPFIVRYLLMLLVWLWLTRTPAETAALRRLRSFVSGSLAITLSGLILALATANYPETAAAILRYYWFRLSDVMVPVGIAMQVIAGPNPKSKIQNPKLSVALWSLVGVALVVYARDDYAAWKLFAGAPRADKSGKVLSHEDWRDVCRWMAGHTLPDAIAITPRMAQSFTWYAQRGQVVSWKDLPQDAVAVVHWWQRLVDIYAMPQASSRVRWHDSLSDLSPDRLRELGRKYSAGYLVVESEPDIGLPREYANGSYTVYRLE